MSIDRKALKKGEKEVETLSRRLERLHVEYVPIGSIEPNSYNPNRQSERDFELLKRSMAEDGFDQPVIVQRATQEIVDGEHRWRAARDLGYETIPVVFVDMTPEQMRISTLRHNRARGSEDYELSTALLRDLRELGALDWAQDSLMLDDREIARLLDDTPVPEVLASYEFGEAWEPESKQEIGTPTEIANVIEVDKRGQPLAVPVIEAASPVAAERIAAAQALLDQEGATLTKHQREMVTWSREVFRLSVTYSGAEAKIVRQVIGIRPAVKVLELCQEMKDGMDPAEWEQRVKDARLPYLGKTGEDAQRDAEVIRTAIANGEVPHWDNERDNLGQTIKK